MRVELGKQRRRRIRNYHQRRLRCQLRSARGVERVATVLSLDPEAVDPDVPVVFREFVPDEPLMPCVVLIFDELVPVPVVPRDVALSPDCAEPLVPLAAEPDVPPLVAPELVEPEPVEPELAPVPVEPEPVEPELAPVPVEPEPVEPELAPVPVEPEPVEPELAPVPALPPVCASAIPINATAAIVASEVTILVDMLIS